jgi:hypothetical protein
MAEASSAKSQEWSPHGRTPRDFAPEFESMPEPDASLQITHDAGGVLISDLAGTIAADSYTISFMCLFMLLMY